VTSVVSWCSTFFIVGTSGANLEPTMTAEIAVALSLVPNLPRRDLGARLRADDPGLLEQAEMLVSRAQEVVERAAAQGVQVLPWNDPRFPTSLLALSDFPPVLWCRGRLDVLDEPAVAIVGSRAASRASLEVATRLAADVAARGVTVVSGLARGVDSAAHRGALRTGHTIAVLGSALDCIYPREHASLADEIICQGLVLSEYPPGTAPLPQHFPARNRLISGLSRAVVIVEASEQSGSLITADWALQQGRDVMAVPGNVLSGRNRGAHALIRDGAKIVECADDILEELGLGQSTREPRTSAQTVGSSAACADSLLRSMKAGEAYDFDELAAASGLDGARLLTRLLQLEIHGFVRRVGGGCFVRLV
jgi:DNA processing protein